MANAKPQKGNPSDSEDKDGRERNPSPVPEYSMLPGWFKEFEDQLEYDDASTTTSTSSDWMGPPHGHRIIDPIEYNFGIFAVIESIELR